MFPLTTDRIRRLVSAFLILKAGLARADGPAYWKDITIEPVDCPAGSKWIEWTNSFVTGSTRIDNPYDVWTAARGMPEVHDGTGLPLKLQQGLGKNDTALASASEWRPPVYAKIDIQSTGAPGIPSTFNFRRESDKDWQGITLIGRKEIDLIIATIQADSGKLKSFMSIPLWVPAGDGTLRKLKTMGTDKELEVVLSEGTEFATDISKTNDDFVGDNAEAAFDENWAITWKDFKPYDDYHTYAMKWLSDSIEWYAGQKDMAALRITLNKKTDGDSLFPTMESLPIRLGPYEAAGDWAGEVDWGKYPEPTMKVTRVDINGCRVINEEFDKEMADHYQSWK